MKLLLVAFVSALLSVAVLADTTSGRVDDIDHGKRTIIVDDAYYLLGKDVQVVDANGKNASLFAIRKGRYIEGNFNRAVDGSKTITSLRIMSKAPTDEERRGSKQNATRVN